jgi:glyoxylase-like metal-dependent hydrolase (beta-lactamase superfamily II)
VYLERLLGNVYYLPAASNIGLIVADDRRAILVDTGVGQRSGRQLLHMLEQQGLTLAAILNTHCHGDHVGGNAYLVEHTGAQVYAPRYDAVVLQYPLWGTMFLFNGADPLDELRTPRFAAEPCEADVIVSEGQMEIAGVSVLPVALPGHTSTHTGYLINDVFFIGDILAGDVELANTALSYAYSVTQRLASLAKLRGYRCAYYVLGHGNVERDITGLTERNIAHIRDVLEFIKGFLAQGDAEASAIFEAVCAHYGIVLCNIRQYSLLYSTLHSFLSHLGNSGEIAFVIRNSHLIWHLSGGNEQC